MDRSSRATGKAKKSLYLIWILDCSGSMSFNGRIQALNTVVRESIPHLRRIASRSAIVLFCQAISFSDGASWHLAAPTPVEQLSWKDLGCGGATDMGAAFSLVADRLRALSDDGVLLPPVLVLASDGYPTDDYQPKLKRVLKGPFGKQALRLSIAMGEDADVELLREFAGDLEESLLDANSLEALASAVQEAVFSWIKSTRSLRKKQVS